jgi:hypothetical protein
MSNKQFEYGIKGYLMQSKDGLNYFASSALSHHHSHHHEHSVR